MGRLIPRHEAARLATGRDAPLFDADLQACEPELRSRLEGKRILVIGGAGSIGAATVAELDRFGPAVLHVVDINENGLAELVRDLRGRPGGVGARDFRTLPLDFGGPTMGRFLQDQPPYELVLNFAAVKHVRSEKDVYSLLHMLDTNVLKARRLLQWLQQRGGTARYFSVSTDKAANPVNLMGASKRLMERMIFAAASSGSMAVTSARFANVAFSAGSLLEGWLLRLEKGQPLAVPRQTRRYFISLREAGQLCLLAAIHAAPDLIVIPRLDPATHLVELERIARALLQEAGYVPAEYSDEASARVAVASETARGRYPLLLTLLDTAGEKPFEEFIGPGEATVELGLRNLLGVPFRDSAADLTAFVERLERLVAGEEPTPPKQELVAALSRVVPELRHLESPNQLDQRL